MLDFTFCAPTKVLFGRGAVEKIGTELKTLGAKKVLIVYGSERVMKNGLIPKIKGQLDEHGIAFWVLSGVLPNPRMEKAKEGVRLGRAQGVDFLLAVGGGSVIDTAKAIGYGLAGDIDLTDLYLGRIKTDRCLPVAVVSTIAAAGSETSNSSVITIEEGNLKRGYNNDCARPVVAFMDPVLTMTTPAYQTASGAADIMMHTMERYFTRTPDVELIDGMSEGLLCAVRDAAVVAVNHPDDYEARATLLWGSSISHNGLLGTGRETDFASHKIEHELSGLYDVAHGAGLCAVWGSWARFVMHADIERFCRFAERVFSVPAAETAAETAERGVCAWEDFCRSIGMPTTLKALGICPSDQELALMADKATNNGEKRIGSFVPLSRDDVLEILKNAR